MVTNAYVLELQEAVNPAGIKVIGVKLNDLTDAPEIAQALALVDARKTIVEGAVDIVKDAIQQLEDANQALSEAQRQVLISNLLVVICSGESAQPVIQVQAQQT